MLPVHPHGRGDNRATDCRPPAQYGSPPRAWGQCRAGGRRPPAVRFTPTGVGTMAAGASRTVWTSVHPHGRGDNVTPVSPQTPNCGSPPRAWGQFDEPVADDVLRRFTPTGVGTMHSIELGALGRVLGSPPRAWGQCDLQCFDGGVELGSPPRAWGQCAQALQAYPQLRFTPTGVGTMLSLREISAQTGRFTPTGVGTIAPDTRDRCGEIRFTPTGVGTMHPAIILIPRLSRFTPTGVGTMLASQAF